jgi:hypothetical protein
MIAESPFSFLPLPAMASATIETIRQSRSS